MAVWVILIMFWSPSRLQAQFTIQHTPPAVLNLDAPTLSFELMGSNEADFPEAYVMFAFNGNTSFERRKATFLEGKWQASIPKEQGAGSVRYYFVAEQVDGQRLTYPSANPETNPVILSVATTTKKKVKRDGRVDNIDYTVLTPNPEESVNREDIVVSVAIFYQEGQAESENFKIYFNGNDVSAEATISPYLISFVPKNVPPGEYSVDILYLKDEKALELTSWKFLARDPEVKDINPDAAPAIIGNAELMARNQRIGGDEQRIYQGNFNVQGKTGALRYAANGLLTSLEDDRLQPQNRVGAELYLGNWFEAQAGHIYPQLNPLILNGNRIFGIHSGLHLFNKNLNFQVVYGEMLRSVDNLYTGVAFNPEVTLLTNGDTLRNAQTGQIMADPAFQIGLEQSGLGTFKREVLGARFSIGNGRLFSWGINALKVEDDLQSIDVIEGLKDVPTEKLNALTPEQKSQLEADPDLLIIKGDRPKAQGNFMAASDFLLNLDGGRIRLRADVAASLLNEDIAPGVLNRDRAKDLGFEIDDNVTDILGDLSNLIIINENMRTLPIEFKLNENGEYDADFFIPTSIFAGKGSLNLNYLNNNVSFQYQWIGPDFTPLSNTALRRDIVGFSLNDRIRLFQNRIYVNIGLDRFEDNLNNTLAATTNTNTYRAGVSWYPFNRKLPRLGINYRLQTRDNGVIANNFFLQDGQERFAVRHFNVLSTTDETGIILPDSISVLATPRDNTTNQISGNINQQLYIGGAVQDITLSYSKIKTTEDQAAFRDYDADIFGLRLDNRFGFIPLRVNVDFNYNKTEALSGLNTIDILGLAVGADYFLLKDKLRLSAKAAVATNENKTVLLDINNNGTPTEFLDDFFEPNRQVVDVTESTSYIFNASARYTINQFQAVSASTNITNVRSRIGNLSIPNDRVLQLRYIVNF